MCLFDFCEDYLPIIYAQNYDKSQTATSQRKLHSLNSSDEN